LLLISIKIIKNLGKQIMKEDLIKELVLGEGITADLVDGFLKIKGPKGETTRQFVHPRIGLSIENKKIILKATKATKREKTLLGSMESHIKNMIWGVEEPHVYKLKICSGHFPMNVSVSGQELVIKNFLGESVPRTVTILPGAEVKVSGDEIIVSSPDKEVAGQTAARIESLCRITNRDRRIFQDGCYLVEKAGKKV